MQCKFNGFSMSRSANIVHSENILKPKLQGDQQGRGRKNVLNLNTLMHSTVILKSIKLFFPCLPI